MTLRSFSVPLKFVGGSRNQRDSVFHGDNQETEHGNQLQQARARIESVPLHGCLPLTGFSPAPDVASFEEVGNEVDPHWENESSSTSGTADRLVVQDGLSNTVVRRVEMEGAGRSRVAFDGTDRSILAEHDVEGKETGIVAR